MKQIIRNIGCFVFVVFVFTSCNLEELAELLPHTEYIHSEFYVINKTNQDIEVEYVMPNKNYDKFRLSIAKGDTNRYVIYKARQYKFGPYNNLEIFEKKYQEFLDRLDPEIPEEYITECFPCIESLNYGLQQINIYDASKNKVRSWVKYQWKYDDTPSRSPFYGYPPYWKENWSSVVEEFNNDVKILFTYTITDDDLIPEESAEE